MAKTDKYLKIIEEGLDGNCFYWEFVIQHLYFMVQRGNYVDTVECAADYLEKLVERYVWEKELKN